jgi:hypothetical protein
VAGNQEVKITIDDGFTEPACNCCVGFLRFKVEGKERKIETAEPAGTGTFVKLDSMYGILTAAHVLKPMGANEVVGLVRFPSVKPALQNFRLNVAHTERISNWNEKDGDAPDIGFVSIPEIEGKDLEAKGAVFYNLRLAREYVASKPEHRMAKCYALVGVVGEWTEESSASPAEGRKVIFGGLFGAAKNLKEFEENKTKLVEVEVDYAAGPKVPKSYGGVSGGALWELHVELDKDSKPIEVKKRLYGVAFRQSEDHTRITSNATTSVDAMIERIAAKWPKD